MEEAEKTGLIFSNPPASEARFEFSHELIRQVVLNGLSAVRRERLHLKVADAIERVYSGMLEDHFGELAHHYRLGDNPAKAITYLVQAAEQATARLDPDAASYLDRGLALIEGRPETSERNRQELILRNALGRTVVTTQGPGVPEVERAFSRARQLSYHLRDHTALVSALVGLRTYHRFRLELGKARVVAEELVALVGARDPVMFASASYGLGDIYLFMGEFDKAREHLVKAAALPQSSRTISEQHEGRITMPTMLGTRAWVLWVIGYPQQALVINHEAVVLARQELGYDPNSLLMPLAMLGRLNQWRHDAPAVLEQSNELSEIATEYRMPFFLALALSLRGWARAELGEVEEGILDMRQAAHDLEKAGVAGRTIEAAALAEFYGKAREPEAGLAFVGKALDQILKTGERICEAELHRLKGEMPLLQAEPDSEEAERCFRTAIRIAQRQGAKSWELRATTSLARLLARQGHREHARGILAEIYGWFTEGFDTVDLQDAKALLNELN